MPLEENIFAHAKDIAFLQVAEEGLDISSDRAYVSVPRYRDHPVALHPCKLEGPFARTDVPGLCADRVHRADTLDGHLRGFDGPDAQVVHARLAVIVMN